MKTKYSQKKLWLPIAAFLVTLAPNDFAVAQTPPEVTDPATGIQVLHDALSSIQNELAQRGSQTQLTSPEYQSWNKNFREVLNQTLDQYEQSFESDILPPLKPLTDQYKMISEQTVLRPDQIAILEKNTATELQSVADTLATRRTELYINVVRKLFSFLPVPNYTPVPGSHGGIGFDAQGHQFDLPKYDFEIDTIGVSGIPRFAYTPNCNLRFDFVNPKPETWSISERWRLTTTDPDFGDLYTCVPDGQAHVELKSTMLFSHFEVPVIEQVCTTQLCEALVQQDLARTFELITKVMNNNFEIQVPVCEKVGLACSASPKTIATIRSNEDWAPQAPYSYTVNARPYSIYSSILNSQYTDPKLPFKN